MNNIDLAKIELLKRAVKRGIKTPRDFMILKNEISEEFKIDSLPNYGLTEVYNKLVKSGKIKPLDSARGEQLKKLLKKAKMRTLSGVAVVSVLTKPYKCPGECLYCPTEKGMPKSYLSNEPAVMRAILAKFDPYRQVEIRLRALEQAGHSTDKIELIVMGGSFNALPEKYQYWFVGECFRACNIFNSKIRNPNIKILNKSKTQISNIKKELEKEQKKNEKAKHRIIGLTLETRPDLIDEKEILKFREMGCTRVEIGVQSVYDEVLDKNKRGHGRAETIRATKLLKDAGFKVSYHMMPGLYGSDLKKDFQMFKEIFSNLNFQPDLIKIYPCVVTKNSELYKLYKSGRYRPYTDKQLLDLIIKIKKIIPPYVRISRLIRDIPEESIVAGNKITNLRQVIENDSQFNNWKCNCIRCREVRDKKSTKQFLDHARDRKNKKSKLILDRIDYDASGGKEIFLQYIDPFFAKASKGRFTNRLYAMLRLRVCDGNAIIREVHTYGEMINVGESKKDVSQHKGLGRELIKEAEKIAKKEFSLNKIAIISGVGAREYYRKLEYILQNTYMMKEFKNP